MPGIAGIVAGGPRESLRAEPAVLLEQMLRRMRHHDWYLTHAHADAKAGVALGRTSLGFVPAAVQPALGPNRGRLAVLEGELYETESLRRELGVVTDAHVELLLHGTEREGKQFLNRVQGAFSAAIWDEGDRRLLLVNDRFGVKPLYYAHLAGRLLFASEIKALLVDAELSRAANRRGLAQFFTYGQLLGESTLLDAVHVLPAAAWLTYDAAQDRLQVGRYASDTVSPPTPLGEAEHLERIDRAFKKAVDRRSAGTAKLGLSLSGGLDSRTILAAVEPDQPVQCVSMGVPGSMDHACAAEMARLAGRPHHACYLNTDFLGRFETHLNRMVHLTDGHYLSQCVVMPTLPVYRELGIEVLLRGHAGELMHMHKAYNFSLDDEARALRDTAELESWLFRHLQAYMLDGVEGPLLAGVSRREIDDLARQSLRDCLKPYRDTRPLLHQVWQLFIGQRTRRETAMSLVKFGSLVETRLPYVDGELLDALFAAPPELKWGDRLQTHILRKRMPSFLNVVNTNTGARMGAGKLAAWFARTRMRVYGKLGVRGYQPYERLGLWLRRELRPLVGELLLCDRCLGRGLFDADTVRSVVRDHFANRKNHTFLIMALLILETGQRAFIDGSPSNDGGTAPEARKPLAVSSGCK